MASVSEDGSEEFLASEQAFKAVRRQREGLRHVHARPLWSSGVLERGGAADQRLLLRGDPRKAFLLLLSARRSRSRRPWSRARARSSKGPLGRRGLAHAQGRIALLG